MPVFKGKKSKLYMSNDKGKKWDQVEIVALSFPCLLPEELNLKSKDKFIKKLEG